MQNASRPPVGKPWRGVTPRKVVSLNSGTKGPPWLVVSQGSVVDFEGCALVNAANEGCMGGGGVDGAVSRAGGRELAAEREALPEIRPGVRCPTGAAVMTTGGSLKVKHCIHAVGPVYGFKSAVFDEKNAQLRSAYRSSLKLAKEADLETVGFALLSSAIFRGGQKLETVLHEACAACAAAAYPGLLEVHLVAFQDHELKALLSVVEAAVDSVLRAPPAEVFKVGDSVEAHGLKAEALNGHQGTVVKMQGDRVGVAFGEQLGEKALRPQNLKHVSGPDPASDLKVGATEEILAARHQLLLAACERSNEE